MFRFIFAAFAAMILTTNTLHAQTTERTVRLAAVTADAETHPAYCNSYPAACTPEMTLRDGIAVPKVVEPHTLMQTPNTVKAYCNTLPHAPVCGEVSWPVSDVIWQHEVLRRWNWEPLLASETAEGETFGPSDPVVLVTDTQGRQYLDRCAIGQKNLLVIDMHVPSDVLAVGAALMADGARRGVLVVHTPFFFDLIIDCEEGRIVQFETFVLEGHRLVAVETKVSGTWGMHISHAPKMISREYTK